MTQEKTSQNFTRRLVALKAATGAKWDEVAGKLGVTREHLYNYRVGKHCPPEHIVLRLAAAERAAGIVALSPGVQSYIAAQDRLSSGGALRVEERAALEATVASEASEVRQVLAQLESMREEMKALRAAVEKITPTRSEKHYR